MASPRTTSITKSKRCARGNASGRKNKTRIVADTYVLISAFIGDGAPRALVAKCAQGDPVLLVSYGIVDEYSTVIERPKFRQVRSQLYTGLMGLLTIAQFVEPATIPRVVPEDPDDDMIIATAVHAQADAIVSGDRHLLTIQEYRGIPIMTVKEFVARRASRP